MFLNLIRLRQSGFAKVRLSLPDLVIEEELPGVVALEEKVQVVQHGRVVKHEVHDLMTEQSAKL
jgi:hypothetical protein